MTICKTIWNINKRNNLYYDEKVPLWVEDLIHELCYKMGSKDRGKGKDHRNAS